MASFQKLTSSQSFAQLHNSQLIVEEYDLTNDFSSTNFNNQNLKNSQNQNNNSHNMKQKASMSMSMVDENSNTIPFFQKRHSVKSIHANSNDQQQVFQNKPLSFITRQPVEEVVSLQPSQIYFSSKQSNSGDHTISLQNAKYTLQNQQRQGNNLNHYSNDLSPIEMTQQQLSTQSSSPEYDLAIIKNTSSSSSQQNTNLSNKTGSFVGCGYNNGMSSSNSGSQNVQQRNSALSQQQQGVKKLSQCNNSMQDMNSISTATTKYSTNDSTGMNKNSTNDYAFQDECDEMSIPRDNFALQMQCQQVEDFSLYIEQYENNSKHTLQTQSISQEDIYQEKLFGNNPLYVPKYGYKIIQNLFKSQVNYKLGVITDPRDLNMRENLIDLMSRLHSRLRLQNETFYLAVNIYARYLDKYNSNINKQVFQNNKQIIIVITCLFIAAKYQEIYPPPLRDFHTLLQMYMEASSKVILECEGSILNKLNFSLFGPTRLQFFEAYLSQATLDNSQKCFCYYLLELTNLNHSFYRYDHSEIAAATILLSEKFKNISGKYFWNENLEILTNYKQQDLYDCVEELYQYLVNVGHKRNSNIYLKYSDPKYKSVSQIDYDLTHNVNNQNAQQTNSDNQGNINNNQSNQQMNYQPQIQVQQQNYMSKSLNQSQQLNNSMNSNSNNINNYNMNDSTYINTNSQNNYNCENQSQQQQQQYYSQQISQNSQSLCSKAKSECFTEESNENIPMNYMSEVRAAPQYNRQYDITRYLKNCKPSYKQ